MKKILLVFILAIIVTTGTAFADHPTDKLGIGVMGGWYGGWSSGSGWGHTALSLKIPNIPVFWSFNLGFGRDYFRLGASGDFYFIERPLVPDFKLHWFAGVGGWVNVGFSEVNDTFFNLGARLPIGISWHLLDFLEIFIDAAPSLGFQIRPEFDFPAGGWPIELGARLWF